MPEVVHSDNGTSLLSKTFQDSLRQLDIQTTQTPTYSPQGNWVERSHRTLGASLQSDDSTSPGSWPVKLNTILFELNNARNRVTGVSPFYALIGRNPRLPLDVCFPPQNVLRSLSWNKYVENLSDRFKEIHQSMRKKNELLNIPMDQGIKSPRGMDVMVI